MNIVIIIASYNERKTIGKLIDLLAEEFKKISNHNFKILVVDGNSPDGTGSVVLEKAKKYDFVYLLTEKEKAGLGAAYIYGFKHALKEFNPDVLFEMDADLQHSPSDLPKFIKKIENGFDYVLGSRFVRGGSIPQDWGIHRKFMSFFGNITAKMLLGIYSINDFTTGYKASRVKGFVDTMDLDNVLSKGFAYKLDWLFRMHKMGAKISEVPITFNARTEGSSKMQKNNPFDSLRVVLTLRFRESQSFIKFGIVGLVGFIVDAGLFNILRISLLESKIAALFSGGLAMITTFILNNAWSFGDRKITDSVEKAKSFVFYVISSTIPILVRSKLVGYATHWFGDTVFVSNTAFLIGITFGLVWNYVIYSRIIWNKDSK